MNETAIKTLLAGTVKAIVQQLPGVDTASLQAVREAEAAAKDPRETLIAALDAEIASRGDPNNQGAEREGGDPASPPGGSPPKGSEAAAEEPAFLRADYTGPLTIDQADRRRAKFAAVTKPAKAPETK